MSLTEQQVQKIRDLHQDAYATALAQHRYEFDMGPVEDSWRGNQEHTGLIDKKRAAHNKFHRYLDELKGRTG